MSLKTSRRCRLRARCLAAEVLGRQGGLHPRQLVLVEGLCCCVDGGEHGALVDDAITVRKLAPEQRAVQVDDILRVPAGPLVDLEALEVGTHAAGVVPIAYPRVPHSAAGESAGIDGVRALKLQPVEDQGNRVAAGDELHGVRRRIELHAVEDDACAGFEAAGGLEPEGLVGEQTIGVE
jgi:hypothetical protein